MTSSLTVGATLPCRQLYVMIPTHDCIRDLDARGGHIHVDIEPSMAYSGELVHGLIQGLHSHSMRHFTRSNVGALYSLIVFMASMHCTVAHRAGTHSRSVG